MTRMTLGVVTLLAISFVGMSQAIADQCTTKISCNKDPAYPKCQLNPARLQDGWRCIARNNIACGSPYLTWNCNPGYACNGDGRDEIKCRPNR